MRKRRSLIATCLVLSISLAFSNVMWAQSLKTVIPPTMNDRWMTEIAEQYPAYANQPLNKTLFPGSHDSGAYDLSAGNSPDQTWIGTLQSVVGPLLPPALPLTTDLMHRWAATQNNFKSQLEGGVRFFDMRMCGPSPVRLCHGFYGPTLESALNDMRDFLQAPGRSKEVLILNFAALGGFNEFLHVEASFIIHEKLGAFMYGIPPGESCSPSTNICNAERTLGELWSSSKQVIAIYPDHSPRLAAFNETNLWMFGAVENPWPNRYQTGELAPVVQANLTCRCNSKSNPQTVTDDWKFFGLQIQVTQPIPGEEGITVGQLVDSILAESGLKAAAERTNPVLISTVLDTDHPNLNIVLNDFTVESGLVEAIKNLTLARLEKNAPVTTSRAYLSRTVSSGPGPATLKTSWNGTYFGYTSKMTDGTSGIPTGDAALTSFQMSAMPKRLYAGGLRVTAIQDDFLRTTRTWSNISLFDADLGETSLPMLIDDSHSNDRSANFATAYDNRFYVAWTDNTPEHRVRFAYSRDAISFPAHQKFTLNEEAEGTPVLTSHMGWLYIAWVAADEKTLKLGKIKSDNTFELVGEGAFEPGILLGIGMTGFERDLFFAWAGTDKHIRVARFNPVTRTFQATALEDTSVAIPSVAVFKGSVYLAYTGEDSRQYTLQFVNGLHFSTLNRVVQEPKNPLRYVRAVLHAWGDSPTVSATMKTVNGADYTPGMEASGDVLVTFKCEAPVAGVYGFLADTAASTAGEEFVEGDTVVVTVKRGGSGKADASCVDLSGFVVPKTVDNIQFAKIIPQINWNNPADIVYGTLLSATQLNATATKPGTTEQIAGTFTYNYPAGTLLRGGTGQVLRVTFTPTDTTIYNSNTREVVINVRRAPATITAIAATKIYGNSDPAFTGTTSGFLPADGLTPTYTRTPGENVAGSPYTITPSVSSVIVDVLNNYDITLNTAEFWITRRTVAIAVDPQSKKYGDADPQLTYAYPAGSLVGTDAFTGSLGREPGEDTGTYAITQGTLTPGNNYALTFTGADLTVTARPIRVTADAKSKIYGDADPQLTYQYLAGSLVGTDVFTGSLGRVAGENVGTHAITQGTLTPGNNYALTFTGADLTVTVRPVTVAADARSKVYGAPDPTLTYQVTNGALAFTDTFTGTLNRASGENIGTYAIQQNTLALSTNYTVTYVGANLTINPRPATVTAGDGTKIYGDQDPPLGTSQTGFLSGDVSGITLTTTRAAGSSVGGYATTATATGGAVGNYNVTYVAGNFSITRRPLTVTANNAMRPYGVSNPAFTVFFTGFANGDTPSSIAGTAAFTTAATLTSLPETYPLSIAPGSLASPNYAFTAFVDGTLTVTATAAAPTSGNGCNGAYSGTFSGNLTVSTGQTCIFYGGGRVTGNINLNGGSIRLLGDQVGGNIQASGNSNVVIEGGSVGGNIVMQSGTSTLNVSLATINGNVILQNLRSNSGSSSICGANIGNNLTLQGNGGPLLIGGAECAANSISGNLIVQSNTSLISINGNTVSGNLLAQSNSGALSVFSNRIRGNLQCQSNSSITGGANTARQKQGQCSAF